MSCIKWFWINIHILDFRLFQQIWLKLK